VSRERALRGIWRNLITQPRPLVQKKKTNRGRQCELEEEDNEHVWNCSATADTVVVIWKEAMDKIGEWDLQATNNKYNAARKREYKRAVANGREMDRPVPIRWHPPSDADHIRGFSSIGGTRAVHSGSPAPDRDENPR
jgi:hypothetical protein